MDGLLMLGSGWRWVATIGLTLMGMLVAWHGLRGTPARRQGLLRSTAGAQRRLEGWRRLLVGLTLIGLGMAWGWESRLLLFLSLGIAFVELWEASVVISVAKRGAPTPRA
jgi:hypothetical protein